MALRAKPNREAATNTEEEAQEYINRGGASAGEVRLPRSQPVNLKIPRTILRRVDNAVDARSQKDEVPFPRTHWILEAIIEKLKREKF